MDDDFALTDGAVILRRWRPQDVSAVFAAWTSRRLSEAVMKASC